MNPLMDVVPDDTKLEGVNWREPERPRNKYDIFGMRSDSSKILNLPVPTLDKELPGIEEAKRDLNSNFKKVK